MPTQTPRKQWESANGWIAPELFDCRLGIVRFPVYCPRLMPQRSTLGIAYLFSRYPEVFATYADSEMLALARRGKSVGIASMSPPATSFRHGYASKIGANILYAPHPGVREAIAARLKAEKKWPEALVRRHEVRFGGYVDAARQVQNAAYFAGALPAAGVRHLHVHYVGDAAYTARLLKEMTGLTFSVTIHDHDWIHGLPQGLMHEICAEAEFLVCISEFTRRLVLERHPEFEDKLHVVHKGVDLERFPQGAFAESECLRLLGIGPLNHYKGFGALVDACALLKRRGLAFSCEIVGDGPLAEELAVRIAHHELGDQVVLTGMLPQEQVADKLRDCDIFVLPGELGEHGECDAIPVVLIEAMAAAKPVICSRIGGVEEVVVHDETGLLVEQGTPEALARSIFTMLADHDMRRRFGMMARARVEARFSINETAERLLRLFESHVPPAAASALGSSSRGAAAAGEAKPPIVCVCRQWPDPRFHKLWGEYVAMARSDDVLVVACRVPVPFEPRRPEIAALIRYLPDAMVEEADWRQAGAMAMRIEAMRGILDRAIDTELFLANARHALALHTLLQETGSRHIHALDSEALVVAWIACQLSGAGLSATIESPPRVQMDAIARMSPAVRHGRVATIHQRELLGSRFELDSALDHGEDMRSLIDNLVKWKRTGERDDVAGADWLTKLRAWAKEEPEVGEGGDA